MKEKDIEKKILNSLEDNTPLNQRVLDKALNEMDNSKPIKQPVRIWKYAVACCALIAICLAIVLPIALSQKPKAQYIEMSYSSMQDYLKNSNIDINTLDEINSEYGYPNSPDIIFPPSSGDNPDNTYPMYQPSECKLIKYGKKDICINEAYTFSKKDKLECYLLLDNSDATVEYLFGNWQEFDKKKTIEDVEISYFYDASTKKGICKFIYDNHTFYMSINTSSESMFLLHIQIFINLQKN